LEVYVLKYDVLNIKAALRGISTGKSASMIPVGVIYSHGLLDDLSSSGDMDSIIQLLIKCRLGGYASVLEEQLVDGELQSRVLAEVRLDGEYYNNLLDMIKDIADGDILSKALRVTIDLTNLQMLLRAIIGEMGASTAEYTISGGYMISDAVVQDLVSLKLTDIPGRLGNAQYQGLVEEVISNHDKTKSITVVDEIVEKHKFRMTREILAPRVLSPLVVFWYLIIKEIEIRNLRTIFKAMFDNISLEEIKDYLLLLS